MERLKGLMDNFPSDEEEFEERFNISVPYSIFGMFKVFKRDMREAASALGLLKKMLGETGVGNQESEESAVSPIDCPEPLGPGYGDGLGFRAGLVGQDLVDKPPRNDGDTMNLLRDLKDPDVTMQDIIGMLIGKARTKKVVLAFDESIDARALEIFKEIERLKKGSPLAGLLENVEIIFESRARLTGELKTFIDSGREVFVFAKFDEKDPLKDLEAAGNVSYVKESGDFAIARLLHPLPYIVAISLIGSRDRDMLIRLMSDRVVLDLLNIGGIEAGDVELDKLDPEAKLCLVFNVLPISEPFDTEQTQRKCYAAWKEAARNA
jgi:hypothetical protein